MIYDVEPQGSSAVKARIIDTWTDMSVSRSTNHNLNSGNALCLKDVRRGKMSSSLFYLKASEVIRCWRNTKGKTREKEDMGTAE